MSGDLGFGKKPAGQGRQAVKVDLSGFAPEPPRPQPPIDDEASLDRVAERSGFTSREATERIVRTRALAEPTDQIAIKGSLSVLNRFRAYVNDNGLTYATALTKLLDIAEKKNR